MYQQIQAKNLASGDSVKFPRAGRKTILRLTGRGSIFLAAFFDDNKVRTLDPEQTVSAELAQEARLLANDDEMYRLDRQTNRVSVISDYAFSSSRFFDIKNSFASIARTGIVSGVEAIALDEIRRGVVLYTKDAVYAKEAEKCQQ